MNPFTRITPAELVFAFGNLAFAGIWVALGTPSAAWPAWVVAHLVGAVLPFWLGRRTASHASVRDVYPLVGIAFFWTEIGLVNRLRPSAAFHDAWVRDLDSRIFGCHLHETFKTAVSDHRFALAMDTFYLGYYLLVFGLPIALLCLKRRPALRDAAYRLLYTYLGCYLLYALFPAQGPRVFLSADAGAETWLGGFENALRQRGDSLGTAFPSSHVAGVFAAALIARRWLPRSWGYAWFIAACGVALSTIYTQNHYAVDVIYGIAVAFLLPVVMPRAVFSEHDSAALPRPRFPRHALAKRAQMRQPERVMP
jgi:hypothetical protein